MELNLPGQSMVTNFLAKVTGPAKQLAFFLIFVPFNIDNDLSKQAVEFDAPEK